MAFRHTGRTWRLSSRGRDERRLYKLDVFIDAAVPNVDESGKLIHYVDERGV